MTVSKAFLANPLVNSPKLIKAFRNKPAHNQSFYSQTVSSQNSSHQVLSNQIIVKQPTSTYGQTIYGQIINRQTINRQTINMRIVPIVLAVFLALLSSSVYADSFYDCADNFYAGTPPEYNDEAVLTDSQELCFNGFATLYSGITRTPIWSAEHLTRERLTQAEDIPREDSFHSERRLPERMQAQLSDYKGSGFDRGHLAPNADMANIDQQYDSFSLANMIPQAPRNNRYVWRNLESVTRELTQQYGETYVFSGVSFEGDVVNSIGEGVLVPTHVFKAVYIPATGEAGVYYAPNDDSERVDVISVSDLAALTGIDIFPAIHRNSKSDAMILPLKVSDMDNRDAVDGQSNQEDPWWLAILIALIDWIASLFTAK